MRDSGMETTDFFRCRIDAMINLRQPPAVLATRLPWGVIGSALAPKFGRKSARPTHRGSGHAGGSTTALRGLKGSNAGRPRTPIRLMAGALPLPTGAQPRAHAARDVRGLFLWWRCWCGCARRVRAMSADLSAPWRCWPQMALCSAMALQAQTGGCRAQTAKRPGSVMSRAVCVLLA
jgi:hypothetical protein